MAPLRQPDSKRGVIELGGSLSEQIQDDLQAPSWLTQGETAFFYEVVSQQRAAGVGMRSVDAENYARYVRYCFDLREASDVRDRLAIGRGIDQLANILCIGEYPRQRIGLRGKKPQAKGKLAIMLAKKNGTAGA